MVLAKKKFGQNFLHDTFYLDQIIEAIPESRNRIVEIGPGLGDLTQKLLTKNEVIAIEVDQDLVKILETKFAPEIQNSKLRLMFADAMQIWKGGTLTDSRFDLVANLPYYIATNLIMKALFDQNCDLIVVLIQKEVAQKFSARPFDRDYGALSVLASLFGDPQRLFDVPGEAFNPVPKVTSSVLRIQKHSDMPLSYDELSRFSVWLRPAFSQPRRTLFKNLAAVYKKEILQSSFEQLALSQTARPHETTSSDFVRLFKLLD